MNEGEWSEVARDRENEKDSQTARQAKTIDSSQNIEKGEVGR